MDNQASSQFIASLIKSIQVVCHGNVEFNHNIEIVGHIYLHVDKCHKFNYVLNEEVLKDFDSTKFVSNSFPAEPPSKEPERKRRKNATPSSTTESDGATEIITIGNDADELSSRSSHPPSVSTGSPTIVVPSTASTSGRQRSRRSSFPANQSALPSSLESERTPPPRHTTTSSQPQTLAQPQTKGQGSGGVSLSSDLKPEVSRQSCAAVSYSSSVRDSYASSNPSSGSANSAATTSSTSVEPDVQIKLEVPSEEEVQLLSHDMVGHVGSSHPAQSSDPSTSPGSAPLYPVMLHQNLAAAHSRDTSGPSAGQFVYQQPTGVPRHEMETGHRLVMLPEGKERDCVVCSTRSLQGGKRRRSRRYCPICNVGCHLACEIYLQDYLQLPRRRRKRRCRQQDC